MQLNFQNLFYTLHSVQETILILRYYIIFDLCFFLTISTNDRMFKNQLKDINYGVCPDKVFCGVLFFVWKLSASSLYLFFSLGPCLHTKQGISRARNCEERVHPGYLWCPQRPESSVTKNGRVICKGFKFVSGWCHRNGPTIFT